jgi:adenylyltransferase/sulfurtransferase
MTKVESAMVALSSYVCIPVVHHAAKCSELTRCNRLNPNVKLVPYVARLTPETAMSTFSKFDIVLDCTDTPASRYLISDTCVLLGKPLVSASALRTDGQLMVLNNPPLPPGDSNGGPCYRCVFPKPPPPESVVSCGDGGILGPVVGVMGVLQALEAIKVLTQQRLTPSSAAADPPSLLIFSAYSQPMFRSIRLRTRKAKCAACSAQASISAQGLGSGNVDYVQFCGSVNPVAVLTAQERISPENYAKLRSGVNPFTGTVSSKDNHILVDTREQVEFELGNIDGSVNIPFSTIASTAHPGLDSSRSGDYDVDVVERDWIAKLVQSEKPVFVVCRRGNDSQLSVKKMKQLGVDYGGKRFVGDIRGGLEAWRKSVDGDFPDY